jgi:hypothetical protein
MNGNEKMMAPGYTMFELIGVGLEWLVILVFVVGSLLFTGLMNRPPKKEPN